MRIADATVHGFRSAFRDWAAECTHYPNHGVSRWRSPTRSGTAVEAAYRRGDLFDKRRQLMRRMGRLLRSRRDQQGPRSSGGSAACHRSAAGAKEVAPQPAQAAGPET